NVHAGGTLREMLNSLDRYSLAVKRRGCPDEPMHLGLWFSARAARELLTEGRVGRLKAWLDAHGLALTMLNGFPFGDFHGSVVKHRVYEPDWRQQARYDYTLDLVRILAELLPEGGEGSISTLPICWGHAHQHPSSVGVAAGDRLMNLVHQ